MRQQMLTSNGFEHFRKQTGRDTFLLEMGLTLPVLLQKQPYKRTKSFAALTATRLPPRALCGRYGACLKISR